MNEKNQISLINPFTYEIVSVQISSFDFLFIEKDTVYDGHLLIQ